MSPLPTNSFCIRISRQYDRRRDTQSVDANGDRSIRTGRQSAAVSNDLLGVGVDAVCPLNPFSTIMVIIIANRPHTLHSTASRSRNVEPYSADQQATSRSISVSVTIVHRHHRQQILSGVFSNSHSYKTSLELTLQVYTHSVTFKHKPTEFESCSRRTDSSRISNQKPITL